jgi:hypothetical protein
MAMGKKVVSSLILQKNSTPSNQTCFLASAADFLELGMELTDATRLPNTTG